MPAGELRRFALFLKERLNLAKDTEFACEASPETLCGREGEKKLRTLRDIGVNRLSIGIQDFDAKVLKAIGRAHTARQALAAVKAAKEHGFESVNVDFIYGLPGQGKQGWEKTLDLAASLDVGSITVAYLRIRPGERDLVHNRSMHRLFQERPELFPLESDAFVMYMMASDKLGRLGYEQRQSNWFTRSERDVSRYLVERWRNQVDTVGFGVAAGSSRGNIDTHNVGDLESYAAALGRGELPFFKGTALSRDEMMRKNVILGLKTSFSKKRFARLFGTSIPEDFSRRFEKLERLELCTEDAETVELTELGRFLSDEICAQFFSADVRARLAEHDRTLRA